MLNSRHLRTSAVRTIAVLAVVAILGGCVTFERTRPEAAQQVLRHNRVHYDLSDPLGQPLTRSQVGFDPGRRTMTIAHPGGRPYIEVTVDLPDGLPEFQVEVSDITFTAPAMEQTEEFAPHSLDLSRTYPTIDDAYRELVAFNERYGLDTRPRRPSLEAFRTQAHELTTEYQAGRSFNSYRTFVWYTPHTTDEFKMGIEAAVFASTGRVGLRYMLRWSPAPSFQLDN